MIGVSTNILPDSARKMKYYASNGKSIDFQGSDDGMNIADHNDFSMTDGSDNDKPFSLSMWVKQDVSGTSGDANGLLIGKCTASTTKEYKLFLQYGQLMFDIQDSNDSNYKRVIGPAQTVNNPHNTWYHIVATYNGNASNSGMRLYRDGLELSTTTAQGGNYVGMPNTTSVVAIGHRLDNSNYDFDGHMKDICIWKDYELSQEEISAMYNDGEFSVDPTVDQGVYDGAAYLKLWLKCEDSITTTAASSGTVYQIVASASKCSSVIITPSSEEYAAECAELPGAGVGSTVCCRSEVTTPAVLGTSDSSGNNHHAADNGNGIALATDSPTSTNIDNEY
jgi:hypothetical protein